MPFITYEARNILDPHINNMLDNIADQGQLAYVLYRLVLPGKRYENYSKARAVLKDVYEVLTGEFMEYESRKKRENGDIL